MKTSTTLGALAACACLLVPAALFADAMASPKPTPSPAPTASLPLLASENAFVNSLTSDLQKRFATTSAAAAAGYFRYNNEDDTGAISWVNTSDWKSDPQHPGQLWYDVKGRLIGCDLTLPKAASASAPTLWGVSATRWGSIPQHVHFAVKQADGSMMYGGYGAKTAAKFGVTMDNPTAADVVKIGKAKVSSDVAFAFQYPAIWDLQVWLVPNPLGPFAEHNPNVIPSKNAEHM
jgi:hypothetical protein